MSDENIKNTEENAAASAAGASNFAPLPSPENPIAPQKLDVNSVPLPGGQSMEQVVESTKLPERRIEEEPRVVYQTAPVVPTPSATDPVPAAVEPPPDPSAPSSLHTMKGDLLGIVRERKISLVRAAALEAEKRRDLHPESLVPRKRVGKKAILMIIAIIILMVLSSLVSLYAYSAMHPSNLPQTNAPAILFAERSFALPINPNQSPEALKAEIENAITTQPGTTGSITQIVPVVAASGTAPARAATLSEFMQAIGAQPPAQLMDALSPDFFFGVHQANLPSPLFVIPVLSYDRAFAGMLQWESSIDSDLSPIVRSVPSITVDQHGLPVARTFKDTVQQNYDVRVLQDDSGGTVLYYSFPTPNLLIIATSPYTFPEVLSRLQAARKL